LGKAFELELPPSGWAALAASAALRELELSAGAQWADRVLLAFARVYGLRWLPWLVP
jgi:hypothetical protein